MRDSGSDHPLSTGNYLRASADSIVKISRVLSFSYRFTGEGISPNMQEKRWKTAH
jgi:hypothetical protein